MTNSTPTPPPLDLAAIREEVRLAKAGQSPMYDRLVWRRIPALIDALDATTARAEAAEATSQRVAEAWGEYRAKLGGQIPDYYRNNIDGALTGHWMTLGGTPTGDLADVCACGKSYWPCAALDGGA